MDQTAHTHTSVVGVYKRILYHFKGLVQILLKVLAVLVYSGGLQYRFVNRFAFQNTVYVFSSCLDATILSPELIHVRLGPYYLVFLPWSSSGRVRLNMKAVTCEIAWHNKEPVYSLDFQHGSDGRLHRLATAGVDTAVRVSDCTIYI